MKIIASSGDYSLKRDFNNPFVVIVNDDEDAICCVIPYDILYDLAKQIVKDS
jgi:wobble nucleotide-excising tRNase